MQLVEIYKIVESEYDHHHAILVVSALAIKLTTKTKVKDFNSPGNFTNRINKKTRNLMWEEDPELIELVIRIRDAVAEYEQRQELNGLGGCVRKSLKDIVDYKEKY